MFVVLQLRPICETNSLNRMHLLQLDAADYTTLTEALTTVPKSRVVQLGLEIQYDIFATDIGDSKSRNGTPVCLASLHSVVLVDLRTGTCTIKSNAESFCFSMSQPALAVEHSLAVSNTPAGHITDMLTRLIQYEDVEAWTVTLGRIRRHSELIDHLNYLQPGEARKLSALSDSELAAWVGQMAGVYVDAYNYPLMTALRDLVEYTVIELREQIITTGLNTSTHKIRRNSGAYKAPSQLNPEDLNCILDDASSKHRMVNTRFEIAGICSVLKSSITLLSN